ncbi:MAG: DNA-3-methyladenine glycosylase 2 family protein [Desulfovibrionaceae bacterium]|nr:DNA-3-methyladenine glycosylase 2 family protein [Desulfovibrionaceae bacterium]
MAIFHYGDAETSRLKKRDKALGAAIDAIGPIRREIRPDVFSALVHSIVGQQISSKAQRTIWERIKGGLVDITPQTVLACTEAELQRYGISFKKASYIRGAAERVADGRLNIGALHSKSDAEVCKELVQVDGVGIWTAEMLMLFSMQRPDILSHGDLAILRGMRMLYRRKEIPRQLFERYRRRYSPYGSVASLYLWAIAGGAIEGMKDYAAKAVKNT